MFYHGPDFLFPANTKDALIVDTYIIIVFQCVTDTPVSHVWMLLMDLQHFFGYTPVKNDIFII